MFSTRLGLILAVAVAPAVQAQISLGTAVDIALKHSPRVQIAAADVAKATAQLAETHDVFIPTITVGAGLGNSYGYSANPPTLFAANSGSLVYSQSQFAYIRSARAGLSAATFALEDARETVAEDAALAFIALDHDQKREAVVLQEQDFTAALVRIVQQRLDAGRDTQIDLIQARLSAAKLHQALLHAQDTTAVDREHLALLLGQPRNTVAVDGVFPATMPTLLPVDSDGYLTPAVSSAFANAKAKQQQAFGDARYLYRPQLSLIVQYNRYATFTDSFAQLQSLNPTRNQKIGANEGVFGVQIVMPFLDKLHQAKARESAADAARAFHEAENARFLSFDAQSKLRHSLEELQASAEVAALEQQLSQQQLEVLRIQLQGSTANGAQMTPKDEQNALISEREKYLAVLDAAFQLRQAQINLLRQTGGLVPWLKTLPLTPTPTTP